MELALCREEGVFLKNSLLVFFVGFFLALLFPFFVSAQSAPAPGAPAGGTPPFPVIPDVSPAPAPDASGSSPAVFVVANVELYNATIEKQDGNTVTVGFDLVNTKGVQPNVQYAIQIFKAEKPKEGQKSGVQTFVARVPLDTRIYDEKVTLAENALIHKSVTYTAPESLNGEYEVRISAFNSVSFLTLGQGRAGTVTFVGSGEGTDVSNTTNPLSPTTDNKDAMVRNVTLDKDWYEKGDVAKMFFFGVAYTEGKVSVRAQMTDGDKKSCGAPAEKTFDSSSLIADVSLAVTERCVNPIITVQIVDVQGKMLDSAIFTFTTASDVLGAPAAPAAENRLPQILIILLGVGALTGLFVVLRRMKGGRGTTLASIVFCVFVLSGIASAAQPADAATLHFEFWGSYGPNKFVTSDFYVGLNKSSYSPGETIVVSWTLYTGGTCCGKYLLNDSDYYRNNFYTWITGIVNGQTAFGEARTSTIWTDGGAGTPVSGTNYFAAPSSAGNYNAEFRGTYHSYYNGDTRTGGNPYDPSQGPWLSYRNVYIPYSVIGPPSAWVAASPNSVCIGSPTTISWGSGNVTSCNAYRNGVFYAAVPLSGSQSYSVTQNDTWRLDCTGPGGNASAQANVFAVNCAPPPPPVNGSCSAVHYSCTAGISANNIEYPTYYSWTCNGINGGTNATCSELKPTRPDLIASATTPTIATATVPTNISTTITNQGSASTGAGSFANLFQIDSDTNHAIVDKVDVVNAGPIGAGGAISISTTYAFPTVGTWYARACADNNASFAGTVIETNEGNNCSAWTSIQVNGCVQSCTEWTACSASCGGGTQTRSCTCPPYSESQSCNTEVCRDYNWKEVAP